MRFFDQFKLEFKAGRLYISEFFNGIDVGMFINEDIIKKKVYGILGLDYVTNVFLNFGGDPYYSTSGTTTTSYCAGIGYRGKEPIIIVLMNEEKIRESMKSIFQQESIILPREFIYTD